MFAFTNNDNWLQYLNLQINRYQLQFCLVRTKIKNRLERSRKIITRSYSISQFKYEKLNFFVQFQKPLPGILFKHHIAPVLLNFS